MNKWQRLLALALIVAAGNTFAQVTDIRILAPDSRQFSPRIAVARESTLTVWNAFVPSLGPFTYCVFYLTVTPEGSPLQPEPVLVPNSSGVDPAVASLADNFLIASYSRRDGGRILCRRISSSGEMIEAEPIVVARKAVPERPTVASDEKNFWVAWSDNRHRFGAGDIYAARLGSDGTLRDRRGIRITTSFLRERGAKLAPDASLIVWRRAADSERYAIRAARLSDNGRCLDPNGFRITGPGRISECVDVAGNEEGWLVVWSKGVTIWGAHVSRSKIVSRPFRIAESGTPNPNVTAYGQDYFVFWNIRSGMSGARSQVVRIQTGASSKAVELAVSNRGRLYSVEDMTLTSSGYLVVGRTMTPDMPDSLVWLGKWVPDDLLFTAR